MFGPNEIYERLKKFKTELLKDIPSGKLYDLLIELRFVTKPPIYSPKLYFVKVDVQACFDSIEQSTLLKILRNVISDVNKSPLVSVAGLI